MEEVFLFDFWFLQEKSKDLSENVQMKKAVYPEQIRNLTKLQERLSHTLFKH